MKETKRFRNGREFTNDIDYALDVIGDMVVCCGGVEGEEALSIIANILLPSCGKQALIAGNVPLQRIKRAVDFYARHEHWMGQTTDDDLRRVLTAMQGNGKQNGWDVAEAVQDDLWAIGELIEQLSHTKEECLLTIDRINAEKATSASLSLESLMWWRELVDLNPADLAPRIDALIENIQTGKRDVDRAAD